MDIAASLVGVALEHPLMHAADTCRTPEDVERFARSAAARAATVQMQEAIDTALGTISRGDVTHAGLSRPS